MIFEEKKLGIESMQELLQCGINTVEPYALMLAPVYVFMKLNEKLVSVKAPLDFFTPEELSHLSRYEIFYIPKFVQAGSRFQTSAKIIRNLLRQKGESTDLAPASYEISNEILLAMVSLWGKDLSIDAFYSAVFADELCGSFNPEKMVAARETAVVRHDLGILLSGFVIFVLLHLGWFDLRILTEIRLTVYEATVDHDEDWEEPRSEWQVVARDLKRIISANVQLTPDSLSAVSSEWARKLMGRIERIRSVPNLKNYPSLKFSEQEGMSA